MTKTIREDFQLGPQNSPARFNHLVAIGASAGGLEAMEALLRNLPRNKQVAYVVVQHMDPTYPSKLHTILQRYTELSVKNAEHDEAIYAEHLYVIPPSHEIGILDGKWQLAPTSRAVGPQHVIDSLLTTVAVTCAAQAVGVILSGSGSDGLLGIRAIKAANGLAIAQSPETARYGDMPTAIIQARLADVIVAPEEIGSELARLLQLPGQTDKPKQTEADAFNKLLQCVTRKTGVSVDQYKETTVRRRIERRRIVTCKDSIAAYLAYVESSRNEANILLQDMLISVTDFFRDADAYKAVARCFQAIVERKQAGETVRLWLPGCATGEEAYSMAILLADAIERADMDLTTQIFATDIDEHGIRAGRAGTYLKGQLKNLPPQLIKKYFHEFDAVYLVNEPIRDMVTFARHDLLQDPPFSRLDFISCRNVLIYFKRDVQERLVRTFHYVLKSGGHLLLGPSESIGDLDDLFNTTNRRAKLYLRRDSGHSRPALGNSSVVIPPVPALPDRQSTADRLKQRLQKLVFDNHAPPSVLVDRNFNILHTHGQLDRWVKLPQGKLSVNLLDMVDVSLRVELRLALQRSDRSNRTVRSHTLVFQKDDSAISLSLVAIPTTAGPDDNQRQLLVLFEERDVDMTAVDSESNNTDTVRVRELDQELTALRDHLQTNVEELEASNEELQSVNEEYQSTLEELQSTNEELQTANEELQSTNEELNTVNEELRIRTDEVASSNTDLEGIMRSAVAGIIVLDRNLCVTRYSSSSREIFDLVPASVGRPLATVESPLDFASWTNTIREALASGEEQERELEVDGKFLLARIAPQPEPECRLVISFVDATRTFANTRESRRFATVLKHSNDAITVLGKSGDIQAWNLGASRMYGYTETEALNMHIADLVVPMERPAWDKLFAEVWASRLPATTETLRRHKNGRSIEVSISIAPLVNEAGEVYGLATTERDISAIRNAEAQRRQAEFAHEARLTTAGEMAAGLAHELNQPVTSIVHFCDVALSIAGRQGPDRDEKLKQVLGDAAAQAQRAGEIIRNLRKFLGRRESVRAPGQINQIIEDACKLMRVEFEEMQVELSLSLADELPLVNVDETQIGQVLANLLRNSCEAMKYADSRPRQIEITTVVESSVKESVVVSIQDSGPGIDDKTVDRLFEPFHTSRPNGLGMGLWMSRSIVESHGGRLWGDPAPENGARFHFSLLVAGYEEDTS